MQPAGRIIIALLIAALLGALYWLWPLSLPQSPNIAAKKELVEAKTLSAQLVENLKREALSDRERHILERAGADWRRNPFEGQRTAPPRQTTGTAPASPSSPYVYSGYMEVDKKRLAIINGMQYQVGDRVESGKYVIRSIEPEKVVVEDSGRREQLVLPFVGVR
jgi:hypothetical protein